MIQVRLRILDQLKELTIWWIGKGNQFQVAGLIDDKSRLEAEWRWWNQQVSIAVYIPSNILRHVPQDGNIGSVILILYESQKGLIRPIGIYPEVRYSTVHEQ